MAKRNDLTNDNTQVSGLSGFFSKNTIKANIELTRSATMIMLSIGFSIEERIQAGMAGLFIVEASAPKNIFSAIYRSAKTVTI